MGRQDRGEGDGRVDIVSIDSSVGGTGSGIEWAARIDGKWEVSEIGSGSIPYEFGVGLAVGADGGLHVVYHDGEERLNTDSPGADLLYATLSDVSDGEWEVVPVDTEGDVGKFASIALDSTGHPHIAYLQRTG